VDGLHIHNLCEKDFSALKRSWQAVEQQLGSDLHGLKWINLGGGHLISQGDYQRKELVEFLRTLKNKYQADIYMEPGEAWARDTGFLVCTVLDVVHNEGAIAILDCSASCHMPDVLEMPYRPDILGAGYPGEKEYDYRLAGMTCLAGDVIGDYSFDQALKAGDRLVFTDMAHYSMVKTNTFNGVNLPSIYLYDSKSGDLQLIKKFGYQDFRSRLS
jgi:carboxynorspermidine decarboxylase